MTKPVSKEELKAAVSAYLLKHGEDGVQSEYDQETGEYLLEDKNKIEVVIGPDGTAKVHDDNKGEFIGCPAVTKEIKESIFEARMDAPAEPAAAIPPTEPKRYIRTKAADDIGEVDKGHPHRAPFYPGSDPRGQSFVHPVVKAMLEDRPQDIPLSVRDRQVQELTWEDIKKWLCPAASDKDAFMFLKLCQARGLNPFISEAYLIPYEDQKTHEIKCSMVVGKEAFMRKAEANTAYKGFEAGIIIQSADGGPRVDVEGTLTVEGDKIIGGWAKVYRSDRDRPIVARVALKDYDKQRALWKSQPATMIRKVALVQALREAFPNDLSGCYDSSEIRDIDPANEVSGGA
jgi:phage recombination protein Bet